MEGERGWGVLGDQSRGNLGVLATIVHLTRI